MNHHAFIADNPHPGTDPAARLRHTLDQYTDTDNDRMAVQATSGIYPDGPTGLTFGDLRELAQRLGI